MMAVEQVILKLPATSSPPVVKSVVSIILMHETDEESFMTITYGEWCRSFFVSLAVRLQTFADRSIKTFEDPPCWTSRFSSANIKVVKLQPHLTTRLYRHFPTAGCGVPSRPFMLV